MAFSIPGFKKNNEEALAMLGVGNEIIEAIIEKGYFSNENIDLIPKDFVSIDEVMEELKRNKNVKYLLISDAALVGLDDGKREIIKTVRSKYDDVIIAMFFDCVEPSEEFIDWAFGHKVYNIYYDAEGNFNFEKVAEELVSRVLPQRNSIDEEAKSKEFEAKEKAINEKQKELQDKENYLKELESKLEAVSKDGETEENAKEIFLLKEQIRKAQEARTQLENNIGQLHQKHEEEKVRMKEEFEKEKEEYRKKVDEETKSQIKAIKEAIANKTPENSRLKPLGCITIGVFSISRGAGSTYIAASLGEALGEMGYPTAVVAMDGKQDLKYAGGDYANYIVPGIADNKKQKLLEVMSEGYTFIVQDFGTIFLLNSLGEPRVGEGVADYVDETNELMRCTFKIGVGFSSPWHIGKLNFFDEKRILDYDTTIYGIQGFQNIKELQALELQMCERDEEILKQIIFEWIGLNRNQQREKERKIMRKGLFR